jgi:hypothetical protein
MKLGKFALYVVGTVAAATVAFKKLGLRVPGFTS